jgi:hypothetical protein
MTLSITLMTGCFPLGENPQNAPADTDPAAPISDQESPPPSNQEVGVTDGQAPTMAVADDGIPPETATEQQDDTQGQSSGMPPADQNVSEQEADQRQPDAQGGQRSTAPTAEQDVGLLTSPDNPGSVTEPSLSEIETNRRNFLVAGVNLNEAAEFVSSGPSSPLQEYSATQIFGSLKLTKQVRRFSTNLDYKGGVAVHRNNNAPFYGNTVQQLTAMETISGKRTSLTLEDSLTDAPGATFGSTAFGGAAAYTLGYNGNSGTSNFLGFTDFGGFRAQRITNIALAQVTHSLTPQSGVTFAGAYALTEYFGNKLVNSQLFSVLGGYNHEFTARDHASFVYGYQYWKFPGGLTTTSETAQGIYTRQVSSRLSLSIGAGPQFGTSRTPITVTIGSTPISVTQTTHQLGLTAEAILSYGLKRGNVAFNYAHFVTSGSGLFAGATSDIAGLSLSRDIWRSWATNFSGGFVRLQNLGNSGAAGTTYQYWFTGVGVRRTLGRNLSLVGSYQYNQSTTLSNCAVTSSCGGITHTLLLSLAWHTQPIRLERGSAGNAVPAPVTNRAYGLNP